MARSQNVDSSRAASVKTGKRKRGVILLLVVSLLALFVLIGVTYAVLATNYFQTTKIEVRINEYGDLPEKEFDLVLGQLLYDTYARSALRYHSLLGDLYGGDALTGVIVDTSGAGTPPAQPNGAQWPNTAGQAGQAYGFQFTTAPTAGQHSLVIDYYAGRVITFVDGPAVGHSTRVLQYDPGDAANGVLPQVYIETIESDGGNLVPLATNRFVINGAPFNGAGQGYDINTYNMDAVIGDSRTYNTATPFAGDLAALLPHFNGFDPTFGQLYMNAGAATGVTLDAVAVGGLDESWDAVDNQNMYLAMVPPAAATNPALPILPSFHRPELVNYWVNYIINQILVPAGVTQPADQYQYMAYPYGTNGIREPGTDDGTVPMEQLDRIYTLTRGSIFRPMKWDHPNFTGSNVSFDSTDPQVLFNVLRGLDPTGTTPNYRLWDIDNDNDGVPDSIWIDPGLPVVTSPDGKRYKRLVSILVKDLDGRIDLNAHGNLQQLVANNRATTDIPAPGLGLANPGNPMTPGPIRLPRGIGFGPAEVDFLSAFAVDPVNPTAVETTAFTNLLTTRYTSNFPGDSVPGLPGARDSLNIVKMQGVPNDYANQLSWYASPPDVWGRMAVSLDYGGQPISALSGVANEMLDNPYEISLSGELNNADSPYTLVELERMLRYHDPDSQNLPSRPLLPTVAGPVLAVNSPGVVGADHTYRERLAGRSSHLPVPGTVAPGNPPVNSQIGRDTVGVGAATILDLYVRRLTAGGSTNVARDFNRIVPWELRHGGKFNINRWLGDGFDTPNGTDSVADDPLESFFDPGNGAPFNLPRETAWQGPPTFPTMPAGYVGVNAEHANGVDVNSDGAVNSPLDRALARQLYARHLYCLALLLFDNGTGMNIGFPHDPTVDTLPAGRKRELYVRRIAQWAVNVVDARDSDSIMTPFEYDLNPWNGWHVDGNLITDSTDHVTSGNNVQTPTPEVIDGAQVVPTAINERGLVWGMEHPELIITETFAFHARNIRDTDNDTSAEDREGGDDDPDQLRIPQGSLYFELYNTRAFNWTGAGNSKPRLPAELYDFSGPGSPRLALGKCTGGWPVWRVGIAELSNNGSNMAVPDVNKPMSMAISASELASFDAYFPGGAEPARDIRLLPTDPTQYIPLERFVWFATPANATGPSTPMGPFDGRSFYYSNSNANPNPGVEPGQYAIVGPRLTTYIGSRDPNPSVNTHNPPPAANSLWGGWSPQRLEMGPGGLTVYDTTLEAGSSLTPAVGTAIRNAVPIVADIGPDINGNQVIPNGWAMPARWNIGLNITEPLPSGNYYPEPPDLMMYPAPPFPIDGYDDLDAPTGTLPNTPADYSRVLGDHNMIETATYEDVSSIYLQRLANPNLPWNGITNPYVTVDWASVDVNVFAGDENTNRQVTVNGMAEDLEPADPVDGAGGRPMKWETRQRGNRPVLPAQTPTPANLWPPITMLSAAATASVNTGADQLYFDASLFDTTLGVPRHSLSWLNQSLGQPMNTAPQIGEVQANPDTFPWLVHFDRPFANPFELMQVASSSPSRRYIEFGPGFWFGPTAATGLYNPVPPAAPAPQNLRAPFGHLLNFFHSSIQADQSPQLQRLFDYVEVPSPYTGAERYYNPQQFGAAGLYRPPFNSMSRFRDAGRININTIFDEQIWYSAISQFPGMNTAPFGERVFRSRQGYGGVGSLLQQNPTYPTLFANPYRPTDASDLMPNVPAGAGSMRRQSHVDATFLRPDPDQPDFPLFDQRVTQPYQNSSRNAYFRYQALQKLGNTFTTHSNVFAVWMTIGYFEVEPNDPTGTGNIVVDAAHPDGLRLGAEIGADSGEIRRHRSFFIIDRSVPVGYVHGQKLNTDNCVLLRRMIE